MTTLDPRPGTAQIYAFPVRHRSTTDIKPRNGQVVGIRPVAFAPIPCGSAWYHENAIRDSERPSQD